MLFGPVEIDLSGGHGLERSFHSERADIDVSKDHGDEQNGHDGMYDLRKLHLGDGRPIKREQQQKPRYRDHDASHKGKPKDKLLPQVKASGRRVFRLDEAAALLDPLDVNLFRKIAP